MLLRSRSNSSVNPWSMRQEKKKKQINEQKGIIQAVRADLASGAREFLTNQSVTSKDTLLISQPSHLRLLGTDKKRQSERMNEEICARPTGAAKTFNFSTRTTNAVSVASPTLVCQK